jgi:hypothetical protein
MRQRSTPNLFMAKWSGFLAMVLSVIGTAAGQSLVIDRVSPSGATVGALGLTIDVFGGPFCRSTPFDNASLVAWNDSNLNTLFIDDHHLQAIVPGSLLNTAGIANLTVRNIHCIPPNTVSNTFAFPIVERPSITTTAIPPATVGTPYSFQLSASGGAPPYSWSLSSGSALPEGLILSASGLITGTPKIKFDGQLSFVLTDSSGPVPQALSRVLPLTVGAPPFEVVTRLPNATLGSPYETTLNIAGGVRPYVWTLAATSGPLPSGVILRTDGVISGTPVQTGTFVFRVQVMDSLGDIELLSFSLTIHIKRLRILPIDGLPPATVGVPYAYAFSATGGLAPYAWSAAGLPPGMVLNAASGILSGTPAQESTSSLLIEVHDAAQQSASARVSFAAVLPRPGAVSISGLPATLAPLSRYSLAAFISRPYPIALTGSLQLRFLSASGVDDPAVSFTGGSRNLPIVIAPGTTQAILSLSGAVVETGTVAGSIELNLSINDPSGGPPSITTLTGVEPESPPVILSASILSTSGQRSLAVTAYSTTREVRDLLLIPVDAGGIAVSQHSVDISKTVSTWFASSQSIPFGGEFSLLVPLAVISDAAGIRALNISISNGQGSSSSVVLAWP